MATLKCPTCGKDIHDTDRCWLLRGRFYCSEQCARRAEGRHR